MNTSGFYEKKKHGTKKFPVAYYLADKNNPQYNMPFHWHTEWELIYVRDKSITIHIDEKEIYAEEGDVLLLRDSMLHGGVVTDGVYECLVFDFYGLFHDMIPLREFVSPFYRMKLLPDLHFKRKEEPEISAVAAKIMDVNYNYFLGKNNSNPEDETGWRELATAGGLGQLFSLIIRKKLLKVNQQESVRSSYRIDRIKNVLEYVEKNYQSPITLGELAEVAGMNPQYFCRVFKEVTMQSPMDYVIYYRLEQSEHLLTVSDLSVMEIALECGFNDCSYFIRVFKKKTNTTPSQYRKKLRFSGSVYEMQNHV